MIMNHFSQMSDMEVKEMIIGFGKVTREFEALLSEENPAPALALVPEIGSVPKE